MLRTYSGGLHHSSDFKLDDPPLRMGKILGFSIVDLFALTPFATLAQAPLNQAEAKRCTAIADDEQRFKCFDDLFFR
jgi:hypothetical protein